MAKVIWFSRPHDETMADATTMRLVYTTTNYFSVPNNF